MHAGMASGLKRRFDNEDDNLSPITLRSMSKYRLVITLERAGLTIMHHAPSFAALTSAVYLPTSKIIGTNDVKSFDSTVIDSNSVRKNKVKRVAVSMVAGY